MLQLKLMNNNLPVPNASGDVTHIPEGGGEAAGETLLLNIDEILTDRADAYRLHRREKEASNYLGWWDEGGSPVRS